MPTRDDPHGERVRGVPYRCEISIDEGEHSQGAFTGSVHDETNCGFRVRDAGRRHAGAGRSGPGFELAGWSMPYWHEEIAKLKQQAGQDILVAGSAQLVQTLTQHSLVDEYRLLVYPVVLGNGTRLFQEGSNAKLRLIESKALPTGVVLAGYEPARRDGGH